MTDLSYPQRMGRILLQATEEVLGEEGLHTVLSTVGLPAAGIAEASHTAARETPTDGSSTEGAGGIPFPSPSQYLDRLERVYGLQSGRGIARRVGRACLPYGLREFGGTLGLTSPAFKLLPFPAKLDAFAAGVSGLLHGHTAQRLSLERGNGRLLWHVEGCPLCLQRHTSEPACHLAVGLAEEALYWLSGGKMFQVEEVACIARGDLRCTLQIEETPIS